MSTHDGEYIATFDPPTVLVLLDEIERLRRVAGAARPFAAMAEAALAMTAMTDPQKVDVDIRAGDFRRLINALALLDGEKDGGGA